MRSWLGVAQAGVLHHTGNGITIWTWGMFDVKVTVHYRDGRLLPLKYYLSYELPDDDGTNYSRVEHA